MLTGPIDHDLHQLLEMMSLNILSDLKTKVHERVWIGYILVKLLILQCPRHQVVFPVRVDMNSQFEGLVELHQISIHHLERHRLLLLVYRLDYLLRHPLFTI